jgi:hypothetical protein
MDLVGLGRDEACMKLLLLLSTKKFSQRRHFCTSIVGAVDDNIVIESALLHCNKTECRCHGMLPTGDSNFDASCQRDPGDHATEGGLPASTNRIQQS